MKIMKRMKRYGVIFIVHECGLVATRDSAEAIAADIIHGLELNETTTYVGTILNNPRVLARAFESEIKKRDESTKTVEIVLIYVNKDNYCYIMGDKHLNSLTWHLREYDENYLSGKAICEYTVKNNTFEHYHERDMQPIAKSYKLWNGITVRIKR
jgi:hypothetical protein